MVRLEGRKILVCVEPGELQARLRASILSLKAEVLSVGEGSPVAAASYANPAVVVVGPRGDRKDVEFCRRLREADFPVVLISSASGLLEVNALRKSAGASIALPATFTDGDLIAALEKVATVAETSSSVTPDELLGEADVASEVAAAEVATPAPDATPVSDAATATATVSDAATAAVAAPVPALPNAASFDPGWLFGRACINRVTGALRIAEGETERILVFEGGMAVSATSNVAGERLGEILARKGRLNVTELNHALVVAKKDGKRLGQTLVEMNVLRQDELEAELAEQYLEKALAAFALRSPRTTFREARGPAPAGARITARGDHLFAEALRRHYDFQRLRALLPDKRVLARDPNFDASLLTLDIPDVQKTAIGLVDGTRSISGIVVRSPNVLEALRGIYLAVCFDLVR